MYWNFDFCKRGKESSEMDCEITYFKAFQFPDPIRENTCQWPIMNPIKSCIFDAQVNYSTIITI